MATIHTIWQNIDLDVDSLVAPFLEEFPDPDISDDEKFRIASDINDGYLEDERQNLDIYVESGLIICIANLGFWDGRRMGYRMIESGNIADCLDLFGCDYARFYVDGRGQLRARAYHHDGVHHLLFREVKPGISQGRLDGLCEKIMNQCANNKHIANCTRKLGPYIQKVYGW